MKGGYSQGEPQKVRSLHFVTKPSSHGDTGGHGRALSAIRVWRVKAWGASPRPPAPVALRPLQPPVRVTTACLPRPPAPGSEPRARTSPACLPRPPVPLSRTQRAGARGRKCVGGTPAAPPRPGSGRTRAHRRPRGCPPSRAAAEAGPGCAAQDGGAVSQRDPPQRGEQREGWSGRVPGGRAAGGGRARGGRSGRWRLVGPAAGPRQGRGTGPASRSRRRSARRRAGPGRRVPGCVPRPPG